MIKFDGDPGDLVALDGSELTYFESTFSYQEEGASGDSSDSSNEQPSDSLISEVQYYNYDQQVRIYFDNGNFSSVYQIPEVWQFEIQDLGGNVILCD